MFVPGDCILCTLSAKHNPPHILMKTALIKLSGLHKKIGIKVGRRGLLGRRVSAREKGVSKGGSENDQIHYVLY